MNGAQVRDTGTRGIAITLDTDWAPDCAIELATAVLVKGAVKATWFVTHRSPAVERLRAWPDLFEIGVHPNFMPGSTHGSTVPEVLDHCMALVPDATSLRTHGLYQSGALLDEVMTRTPLSRDCSLFTPLLRTARAFEYRRFGKTLIRVPFFWEEDYLLERDPVSPCDGEEWQPEPLLAGSGLKVFNFHPIHVFLNSDSMARYRRVRDAGARLADLTAADLAPHVADGPGAGRFFAALVRCCAGRRDVSCIREITADA